MYTQDDYRRMLEDGYVQTGAPATRLEYLSDHIFDFTTYDRAMAELFATKALEVCAAINDETTYKYIEDPERYRWYLLMVNMPFFAGRLEWGTSIRGAWWDAPLDFTSTGLFLNGEQLTEVLDFTSRGAWADFIGAVLAFSRGA